MKWRTDAVTKPCLDAAAGLSALPWLRQFYLAGGTALALYYGHRISVDLDFFSDTNALGFAERQRCLKDLIALKAVIEEEKDGTLHARYKKTHISFFRYTYPLLREKNEWIKIPMANPDDIALMKVGAIIGRGSKKDFFDLHRYLQEKTSLSKLLKMSKKKFRGTLDFPLQAMRAMVYFNDAEYEPDPRMLTKVSWPEVKRFFEKEVRSIARPFV